MEFGYFFCNEFYMSGFISFSPERNGGHIRRICFEKNMIKTNIGNYFPEIVHFLKCYVACKRNKVMHFNQIFCVLKSAAVAMELCFQSSTSIGRNNIHYIIIRSEERRVGKECR